MKRIALLFVIAGIAGCSGTSSAPFAPIPVARIVIQAVVTPAGLFAGDHVQVISQAYNTDGAALTVPMAWSSDRPAIASVSSSGILTGVSGGVAILTAASGGATATLSVAVDGNITGRITVSPAYTFAKVGERIPFSAALTTTLGNASRGRVAIWTTGDTTLATVDAAGVVTPRAPTNGMAICAHSTDVVVLGCGTLIINP